MPRLMEKIENFGNLKSEISDLRSRAEGISRQIRGWADSLQNSGVAGQRYLNDKGRKLEQARKEREEFLEFLRKGAGKQQGEKIVFAFSSPDGRMAPV